jgi:drug/metabolite transporter (DMT)-like permease
LIALVGTAVIAEPDRGELTNPALGDALAIAGAILPRSTSCRAEGASELSLVGYAGSVYAIAALALGAAMVVSGTPFVGFPRKRGCCSRR